MVNMFLTSKRDRQRRRESKLGQLLDIDKAGVLTDYKNATIADVGYYYMSCFNSFESDTF